VGGRRPARQTAIVHLTPGLDGVSRAVNEAERGLLPAEATVVVGQPLTMDPRGRPTDAGLLWIQLQELPGTSRGTRPVSSTPRTAPGRTSCASATPTGSGADRRARPEPRVGDPEARRPLAGRPAGANINLHHGDPYSGSLALDQNLLWRPFAASPGHATPVRRLWQIGASTHPGPGLGAGSGTLVAKRLLEPPLLQRIRSRIGG
jgi:phytoene dehydrogenase-like protein